MDETDFRIVGHLLQHPLAGPQELARQVGLTRNAAARRLKFLQDSGVRLSFFAYPHQDLFGVTATLHLYAPAKPVAGERMLVCPDVIGFDVNHDGLHAITTWRAPGKQRSAALDRLMGGTPVVEFTDSTPGPKHPFLSRLEWKVAGAMLESPRASAAELARLTGLAPRTCQRARQRLIDGKAVRVMATIREDHAEGLPVYRLYVQGKPKASAFERIIGPSPIVSDTVEEGTVYFARAPSLGTVMANAEAVRKLPGVEDVKLILSRDSAIALPLLRQLIKTKAS